MLNWKLRYPYQVYLNLLMFSEIYALQETQLRSEKDKENCQ